MILIALGANKPGPWGPPEQAVKRALRELDNGPMRLVKVSRFLVTEPYGVVQQPRFVNAVAVFDTHLPPQALLARLQLIERAAGRQRHLRWGPRTLDLDIIDYNGLRLSQGGGERNRLSLPHPGISDRVFVLKPIAEIAPRWQHPLTRQTADQMLRHLKAKGHGGEV